MNDQYLCAFVSIIIKGELMPFVRDNEVFQDQMSSQLWLITLQWEWNQIQPAHLQHNMVPWIEGFLRMDISNGGSRIERAGQRINQNCVPGSVRLLRLLVELILVRLFSAWTPMKGGGFHGTAVDWERWSCSCLNFWHVAVGLGMGGHSTSHICSDFWIWQLKGSHSERGPRCEIISQ